MSLWIMGKKMDILLQIDPFLFYLTVLKSNFNMKVEQN